MEPIEFKSYNNIYNNPSDFFKYLTNDDLIINQKYENDDNYDGNLKREKKDDFIERLRREIPNNNYSIQLINPVILVDIQLILRKIKLIHRDYSYFLDNYPIYKINFNKDINYTFNKKINNTKILYIILLKPIPISKISDILVYLQSKNNLNCFNNIYETLRNIHSQGHALMNINNDNICIDANIDLKFFDYTTIINDMTKLYYNDNYILPFYIYQTITINLNKNIVDLFEYKYIKKLWTNKNINITDNIGFYCLNIQKTVQQNINDIQNYDEKFKDIVDVTKFDKLKQAIDSIKKFISSKTYDLEWEQYLQLKNDEYALAMVFAYYYTDLHKIKDDHPLLEKLKVEIEKLLKPELVFYDKTLAKQEKIEINLQQNILTGQDEYKSVYCGGYGCFTSGQIFENLFRNHTNSFEIKKQLLNTSYIKNTDYENSYNNKQKILDQYVKILKPYDDVRESVKEEIKAVDMCYSLFGMNFLDYTTYTEIHPVYKIKITDKKKTFFITYKDNDDKIINTKIDNIYFVVFNKCTPILNYFNYETIECKELIDKLKEPLTELHSHNYAHMDIKLENLVVCINKENKDYKLIDFGGISPILSDINKVSFTSYTTLPFIIYSEFGNVNFKQVYDNTINNLHNDIRNLFINQKKEWNKKFNRLLYKVNYDFVKNFYYPKLAPKFETPIDKQIEIINDWLNTNKYPFEWRTYIQLKHDDYCVAMILAKLYTTFKNNNKINLNYATYIETITLLLNPVPYFYKKDYNSPMMHATSDTEPDLKPDIPLNQNINSILSIYLEFDNLIKITKKLY